MTDMTYEGARWYLAGLFDGEGSVTRSRRSDRPTAWSRNIRIASCDLELLERAQEACELLGIYAKIVVSHKGGGAYASGRPRKKAWCLRIHRRGSLLRFYELVPFSHFAKREKLRLVCTDIGIPDPLEPTIEIIPTYDPVPGPLEMPTSPPVPEPDLEPEEVPA